MVRHIAEDVAMVGSILGKTDGTSKVGDSTHRYAELNIATGGFVDYATSLQFKKAGVNSIRIEADARISGVTNPTSDQDVATKNYVDSQIGVENMWDRSGTTISQHTLGDDLHIAGTLGTNITPALTDGNWVVGSGWENPIAGGVLNKNADGTGTMVPNTGTVVVDKTYKIVVTFSAFTVGTCYINFGNDTTRSISSGQGAGTYTFYNTTLSTQKITFQGTSTSRFTISAVSTQEISGADTIIEGIAYLHGGVRPLIIWNENGNEFAKLSVANDGELSSNRGFSTTTTGETAGFRGYMFRGANSQSYLDFYRTGSALNLGFRAYWGTEYSGTDSVYLFNNKSDTLGRLTASADSQVFFDISPRIFQTGSASYSALRVDAVEQSVGSGSRNILELRTGGSDVFRVTGDHTTVWGTNSFIIENSSSFGEIHFLVNSTRGRNFIIGDRNNLGKDFDTSVSTNPQLMVFSATDPDTSNDQWVGIWHDQTRGHIEVGTGNLQTNTNFQCYGFLHCIAVSDISELYIGANANSFVLRSDTAIDQVFVGLGTATGNQLVIGDTTYRDKDFDHAVQSYPTLFIQNGDPDVDNTLWMSLSYDTSQDRGVINTGSTKLYINAEITNQVGQWVQLGYGLNFYNNDAGGTNSVMLYFDRNNDDALHLTLRGDSKNFIICDTYYKNYDRGTSTDPTLYLFASGNPDVGNSKWLGIKHTTTDAVFSTGYGKFVFDTSAHNPEIDIGGSYGTAYLSLYVGAGQQGQVDVANSRLNLTATNGDIRLSAGSGITQVEEALKVVGNVGFFNTTPVAKTAVSDQASWADIATGAQLVDMSDLNTKVQAIRDKLQSTIDALQSYGLI